MNKVSCPICGEPMEVRTLAEWPHFPFCSARCKTIDLGRWLTETYHIPKEEPEEAPPPGETDTP
jgi:endogenous inhibitor of DNA gyrase (YacG/DUF329 family)